MQPVFVDGKSVLFEDEFMLKGRRVVDDVSVLSADYIIPFKMYALD